MARALDRGYADGVTNVPPACPACASALAVDVAPKDPPDLWLRGGAGSPWSMSTQAAVGGESVGAQGYRCQTCRKTFRMVTDG